MIRLNCEFGRALPGFATRRNRHSKFEKGRALPWGKLAFPPSHVSPAAMGGRQQDGNELTIRGRAFGTAIAVSQFAACFRFVERGDSVQKFHRLRFQRE